MLQSQDYLFQIDVHYLLFYIIASNKKYNKKNIYTITYAYKVDIIYFKRKKTSNIYIVWFHEKLIMYGSIEDNAFCPRILSHLHCQMWPFPLILKDHSLENDKTL